VVTDGYFPRLKRLELYTHSTICLPGKVLFKHLYNCTQCYVYIALEIFLARYFSLIMYGTEFIVIVVAVT
jgi:hypothetical protein